MVTNSPFPARLLAPVAAVAGGPELVINALYLAASEDPQNPDVVVRFKSPFSLPGQRYRVSVLVGDPLGERVRASLVTTGPSAKPTGSIEIGTGTSWRETGPTQVRYEPSGFVMIRLPLASTPGAGAIWAEITEGNGPTPTRTTPFFDRNAFFGIADAGTLPAARFGHVNNPDGAATDEIAALEPGPVLTVTDRKIRVKYADSPPTALLGQPVTEVVDSVRIAPNFDTGGVVANFIRINRSDASVGLYDGFGAAPVEKSGERSWVITGPAPGVGPTTLVFDLDKAAAALGMTLGREATGVALTRSFVLGDGRIVTADGVMATAAWLDLAPRPPPPPSTTVPGSASESGLGLAAGRSSRDLGIVAAVLLILFIGIFLAVRARRHKRQRERVAATMAARAEVGDRVPWAKDDSYLTAEIERVVIGGSAEATLTQGSRVDDAGAKAADVGEAPPAIGRAGVAPWRSAAPHGTMADPAPDAGAGKPLDDPESESDEADEADESDGAGEEGARLDPAAALAALDLDLGSFRSRFGAASGSETPDQSADPTDAG